MHLLIAEPHLWPLQPLCLWVLEGGGCVQKPQSNPLTLLQRGTHLVPPSDSSDGRSTPPRKRHHFGPNSLSFRCSQGSLRKCTRPLHLRTVGRRGGVPCYNFSSRSTYSSPVMTHACFFHSRLFVLLFPLFLIWGIILKFISISTRFETGVKKRRRGDGR